MQAHSVSGHVGSLRGRKMECTRRCKHFSDSDRDENNVTVVGLKPLQCLSVLALITAWNRMSQQLKQFQ